MSAHHKEKLIARRNQLVAIIGVLLILIWGGVMFFTDYFYSMTSLESEQVLDQVSQQLDGTINVLSDQELAPQLTPEEALELSNQAVLEELQGKLKAQIEETN
jgi:hypothetical protein